MANLSIQLKTMLSLQDGMNTKVHPQWQQQGYAWYRALWIECGELMDHQGYKWWKKQQADVDQVQLEIVDIWHFGLSMLFDGRSIDAIAADLSQKVEAALNTGTHTSTVLLATEALALEALATKQLSVTAFVQLLSAANMSFDQLYFAYVGKNVLNFFRQDNGYKDGSYIKQWLGREDNEHLVELAASLDAGSSDYPDLLYKALNERYQQVTKA